MIMSNIIELNNDEIKMGFVASCVEHVARHLNVDYHIVYDALQKTNGIKDYVYRFYDTLHTQSREYISDDIISYLNHRGFAF